MRRLFWPGCKSDVLISRSVGALAKHDETIEQIYFIEQHKRNLWRKLCFACRIMNRYDNVYLLQPNSVNLFLPPSAMPKQTILSIYTRRWYHGIFYLAADGTVEHGKNAFGDELPETGRPLAHMARLSQARHKAALQADDRRLFLINLTLSASASVLRQAIKPKPSLRLSGSGLLINSLIYPASFMSSARQTNSRGWMISPAFTVKSLILLILLAKFR